MELTKDITKMSSNEFLAAFPTIYDYCDYLQTDDPNRYDNDKDNKIFHTDLRDWVFYSSLDF
jgi:hypothetical protein